MDKPVSIPEISQYEGSYYVGGEMLPAYIDFRKISKERQSKESREEFLVIKGVGKIKYYTRSDYKSTAALDMKTNGLVKIRRIYFPGWIIKINGKELTPQKETGMEVSVLAGTSIIKAEYKDPPLVIFANAITIVSILGNMLYLLYLYAK